MKEILNKLRNPTILFSILSQTVALLILLGVTINEETAIAVIGILMSILGSLGIVRKVEPNIKAATLTCSNSKEEELHVQVNGKMFCINCGAEYVEPEAQKS